jgi:four helix bundle protein
MEENWEGEEGPMGTSERKYDLEERLVVYAAEMIGVSEALPATRAGNHVAAQLLRSGTSAAPNYGEALAAESRRDFLHKMGVCLKELRETRVWLRIAARRQMLAQLALSSSLQETEELIRIFNASIRTATRNAGSSPS